MAQRLLVFDRTCRGRGALPGLSHAWSAGSLLYRALGRLDGTYGAASWSDALDFVAARGAHVPIAEIQFWGHGKWGDARVGDERLGRESLRDGHEHHARLAAIRDRLAPDALWWFRTCETLGADAGRDFGRAWSDFFGARVAGHTYVIGVLQSGLHVLSPGCAPRWSASEGLAEGTPSSPRRALRSTPDAPNTITCFDGRLPDDLDRDAAVAGAG